MATTHTEQHPDSGKKVLVRFKGGHPQIPGSADAAVEARVEDWWDFMTGKSWGLSDGNPAATIYAIRAGFNGLPWDDEVVYVKHAPSGDGFEFGHLVHVSEIEGLVDA